MTKNPVFHARTMHNEVRYHFIKELGEDMETKFKFITTNEQLADIFIKAFQ